MIATRFRQIAKIQSTYVIGLQDWILEDGKIHTRYIQDLTQTGRLSSVDPNLQNIPVRLEQGRLIRKAFVPEEENSVLLSSDYSQIELRVLAHISGDEHLIDAFKHGADIHTSTAMRVFNIEKPEDVTPNDRRNATCGNAEWTLNFSSSLKIAFNSDSVTGACHARIPHAWR